MNAAESPQAPASLTPDSVVSELHQLPSAPKVLPRLKRLLQDANESLEEIVKLIRLDPAIAFRVLQVANTAFFARSERCVTVEDAVQRVGFERVYELVSYAVASQVLVRPLDVYRIDSDVLWERSVACALAAEMIATLVGEDQQIAYTTGLLHAIGMVAIDEWALRHRRELKLAWLDQASEYTVSERDALGFTQAEVGAALLRSWDFSPEMWLPLRWQYAPTATAVQARLAGILCTAKWLQAAVLTPGPAPVLPLADVLRLVRITPERLRSCVPELRQRMKTVTQLVAVGSSLHAA